MQNMQSKRNITLFAASTLVVMAGGLVAPALPTIKSAFPNNSNMIKLLLSTPGLFIGLFAFFGGIIADKLGRKKLLFLSLLLYAISGTTGLYLNTLSGLLIGRALLGIAVGGVMTASTTLIADYYSGSDRTRFMGHQSAAMGFGALFFLTCAGGLAAIHWRAPFSVYGLSLFLIPAALFWIEEPQSQEAAKEERNTEKSPVLPIAALLAGAFFGMGAYFLIPVHLPFRLQEMGIQSSLQTGITIGCSTFFTAIISIYYVHIHDKLSLKTISFLHYLLAGCGLLLLGIAPSYPVILIATIITGCSFGLWMPNTAIWLTKLTPIRFRGRVIGLVTAAYFLGQFFSPILIEPIFQWKGRSGTLGVFGFSGLFALTIAIALTAMYSYQTRNIKHV